jgi:transposase-like protein
VEQWAELRRQHFVGGKSIKQLARETGLSRNTIRGRCAARSRRFIGGRRLDRFWIRSRRRFIGCCVTMRR